MNDLDQATIIIPVNDGCKVNILYPLGMKNKDEVYIIHNKSPSSKS